MLGRASLSGKAGFRILNLDGIMHMSDPPSEVSRECP